MNKCSSKEYIYTAKKHVERCSTPLAIGEMDLKTIARHHLTPTKLARIKKSDNKKC